MGTHQSRAHSGRMHHQGLLLEEGNHVSNYFDDVSDFERGWHFYKLSDEKTAFKYFDKAVAENDNIARWHINALYRKDKQYQSYKDWNTILLSDIEQEILLKYYLEIENDPFIHSCIGNLYFYHKNYQQGIKWCSMASQAGNIWATNTLGWYYESINKDYQLALKYFKIAAEANDAIACFNLGILYYFGRGTHQDYVNAFRWFLTADKLGYPDAKINLGDLYYNGHGVAKDKQMGIKLYKEAAGFGLQEAHSRLRFAEKT